MNKDSHSFVGGGLKLKTKPMIVKTKQIKKDSKKSKKSKKDKSEKKKKKKEKDRRYEEKAEYIETQDH